MTTKNKSQLKTLLKLGISIALIILLFQKVPIEKTISQLKDVEIKYFFAALLIMQLSVLLQSLRWKFLLLIPKEQKPKLKSFSYYIFLGYFFNLFLPTGMGGDIVKSYGLGKSISDLGKSASAIIIARILGLSALVILFWFGYVSIKIIPFEITSLMIFASIVIVLVIGWLLTSRLNLKFADTSSNKLISKVKSLINKTTDYKSHPNLVIKAFGYSFLIQVIVITTQYFLFKSILNDVSWIYFFAFIPVISLVTLIPISLYGVGLREWIMLELFTNIGGVPPEICLAAAFMSYLLAFSQASIGGVLLLISNFFGLDKIKGKLNNE